MSRPGPVLFFKQSLKSESYFVDELVNIYFLRPVAATIVWAIYSTRITPNQVTVIAIFFGLAGAIAYLFGTAASFCIAGFLILAKDIFDDADGQLARAKQIYSRRGRFLDSIGDFVVDAAVFSAITYTLCRTYPVLSTILLGILSLTGITLRVSYHVYYQVSFLHLEERYMLNRITEEITDEDRNGDPVALRLQKIFIMIYSRQDRLMYRIDRWTKGKNFDERLSSTWYADRFALRLSGLLGFGTEFLMLAICSWMNELYIYLFINVMLMNGIWLGNILYRRFILVKHLK